MNWILLRTVVDVVVATVLVVIVLVFGVVLLVVIFGVVIIGIFGSRCSSAGCFLGITRFILSSTSFSSDIGDSSEKSWKLRES